MDIAKRKRELSEQGFYLDQLNSNGNCASNNIVQLLCEIEICKNRDEYREILNKIVISNLYLAECVIKRITFEKILTQQRVDCLKEEMFAECMVALSEVIPDWFKAKSLDFKIRCYNSMYDHLNLKVNEWTNTV